MNCDLRKNFGGMRERLPKDERSRIVFSASSFCGCLERVETDRLVVTKSTHEYGSGYRTDLVEFRAQKEAFQELGLMILAVVFSPGGCRVHVALNHPQSVIKNLVVTYSGLTSRSSGHKTIPSQFVFSPSRIERHPWGCGAQQWEPYSLPTLTLTNMKEFVVTDADWSGRDTVMGFGNDDASIRLAEMLLNIGYSNETKFALEGEGGGIRGVGINSAEATFEVCENIQSLEGAQPGS